MAIQLKNGILKAFVALCIGIAVGQFNLLQTKSSATLNGKKEQIAPQDQQVRHSGFEAIQSTVLTEGLLLAPPNFARIHQWLESGDPNKQLKGIFYAWQLKLIDELKPNIEQHLASPSKQVKRLAEFSLGIERLAQQPTTLPSRLKAENSTPDNNIDCQEIITTDGSNETELMASLTQDDFSLAQGSDILELDQDLSLNLLGLTEQGQLDYVTELRERGDDAAFDALAILISDPNRELSQAAIHQLLAELKDQSGHYQQVKQVLMSHREFLDDEQLMELNGSEAPVIAVGDRY